MSDFEVVYISRNEDGLITLWDSPGEGRIECLATVDIAAGTVNIQEYNED